MFTALQNEPTGEPLSPQFEAVIQEMRQAAQAGMAPQQVAADVFKAIQAEQFYILTHPEFNPFVQQRMAGVLQEGTPV